MIEIIAASTAASTSASFTTTGPFVIYSIDFDSNEYAILEQEVASGSFRRATGELGMIGVSKFPNCVYFGAAGTFKISKGVTVKAASVHYEEQ